MTRGRLGRGVAAALVAAISCAALNGCAQHNGDQAAFCQQLPDAPTFESLMTAVAQGTDAQAVAKLDAAARTYRSLEQVAPRSIRPTVARLGDTAERISHNLDRGARGPAPMIEVRRGDGTVLRVPSSTNEQTQRETFFYQEFRNHPSVARSAVELLTYAHDDCGITSGISYLGLNGYQGSFDSTGVDGLFGGGTGTSGVVPGQGQPVPTTLPSPSTSLLPPATTVAAP